MIKALMGAVIIRNDHLLTVMHQPLRSTCKEHPQIKGAGTVDDAQPKFDMIAPKANRMYFDRNCGSDVYTGMKIL